MNRAISRRITLTVSFIGFITLLLSIKPILAHSGHNHYETEPKSTKIEQENIKTSPTTETQKSQETENQTINVTLQETNEFNFIPQPSEIIFFLLVANPIILKTIKQKLYNFDA